MADNDWQVNRTPQDCSKYLLENELYTDVEFQVGDEGTLIKAHKIIMANRSPVFEKMFYGLLAETRFPIKIMDVEPEAFRALLRYCYYEKLEVEPEIALATLHAARKYMLPKLEDSCWHVVNLNVGVENIWECYACGMQHLNIKLYRSSLEYFGKSVALVAAAFKSASFLDIPKCVLQDLLKKNAAFPDNVPTETGVIHEVLISEIEIFKACNAWSEAECLRQKLKPSGKNKRKVLGDCLFLIRFPTMLPDDLAKVVFPTGILNRDEKLSLGEKVQEASKKPKASQKFLSDPNFYKIPMDRIKGAVKLTEYSTYDKRDIRYNSVEIQTTVNLMISGMVIHARQNLTRASMHEVIIEEHTEGKVFSDIAIGNVFGFMESTVRLLEFKEVYLKANCLYTIKAGFLGIVTNSSKLGLASTCYVGRPKSAEAIGLSITDKSANQNIKHLRMRLI